MLSAPTLPTVALGFGQRSSLQALHGGNGGTNSFVVGFVALLGRWSGGTSFDTDNNGWSTGTWSCIPRKGCVETSRACTNNEGKTPSFQYQTGPSAGVFGSGSYLYAETSSPGDLFTLAYDGSTCSGTGLGRQHRGLPLPHVRLHHERAPRDQGYRGGGVEPEL